jgi:hypothetical protein
MVGEFGSRGHFGHLSCRIAAAGSSRIFWRSDRIDAPFDPESQRSVLQIKETTLLPLLE